MKTLKFTVLSILMCLMTSSTIAQFDSCQLLITGNNSDHLVTMDGQIEEINIGSGYIYNELYNNSIFYLQLHDNAKLDRYDLLTQETTTIDIDTTDVHYYISFKIIDDSRIALLNNRQDEVYFIDYEGNFLTEVELPNSTTSWQNLHAAILDNELIVSENGVRELYAIDLNTYERRLYADLSSFTDFVGSIRVFSGNVYVSTRASIYLLPEDSDPIELVNLNGENNISGLEVRGDYLFFQTNFGENIYYAQSPDYTPIVITSEIDRLDLRHLTLLTPNCIEVSSHTEEVAKKHITIYPNPTSDQVCITDDLQGDFEVKIFAMSGQLERKSKNSKCINIEDLSKGLHIIKVTSENLNYQSQKIFIE